MGRFSFQKQIRLSCVALDSIESAANDRRFINAYVQFGLNLSTLKLLTHEFVFAMRACTDV